MTQSVNEGAFEFDAPLLKDVRFAQSLNRNGAVRYTSYSTSGKYTTWKVGLDWRIGSGLTFRTTQSRDIRAPTLDERREIPQGLIRKRRPTRGAVLHLREQLSSAACRRQLPCASFKR